MDRYTLTIVPSSLRTRLLLTHGSDELLRAVLPPPSQVRHERAAGTLLEGLALWLDQTLCVVVDAGALDASFCMGLTDELGVGQPSLFYQVQVVERAARRSGARIRGLGDFTDVRQLELLASRCGGRR